MSSVYLFNSFHFFNSLFNISFYSPRPNHHSECSLLVLISLSSFWDHRFICEFLSVPTYQVGTESDILKINPPIECCLHKAMLSHIQTCAHTLLICVVHLCEFRHIPSSVFVLFRRMLQVIHCIWLTWRVVILD